MSDAQQHRLALPQGTRIQKFEFYQVLGHGGFGITYLGRNITLDIPVAIKEYLPTDLAAREQDLSMSCRRTDQAASSFQWGLGAVLRRSPHFGAVSAPQYRPASITFLRRSMVRRIS